MVNEILSYTYSTASCLQVFLYTSIENLLEDALKTLKNSTHAQRFFVIVPSPHVKKTLLEKCQRHWGYSGLISVGLFEETLEKILCLKYPGKNFKVFNQKLLQLAIYSLFTDQNQALLEFLKSLNLEILPQDFFELSLKLASEILEVLEQEDEKINLEVIKLIEVLKTFYPEYLFKNEALKKLADKALGITFIGFPFLKPSVLENLKNTSSKAYCLVPTNAYLGDVITPKVRLKLLKNLKASHHSLIAEEHPLLANFIKPYVNFYKKAVELNFLSSESNEDMFTGSTTLKRLQISLQEGVLEESLDFDESLIIESSMSPYQECLKVFAYLARFKQLKPALSFEDVLIITHDIDIYSSLLNALGQSFKEPLYFQSALKYDPLYDFLEMALKTDTKLMNHDFFIHSVIKLKALFLNHSKIKHLEHLEKIIGQAHHFFSFEKEKQVTGLQFLEKLKKAFLRASIFDLHKDEVSFEFNFLSVDFLDELEDVTLVYNELISFFEKIDALKNQSLKMGDWLKEIQHLFKAPLIQDLVSFEIHKTLIKEASKYIDMKASLNLEIFLLLMKGCFKSSSDQKAQTINIIETESIPHQSYELIIYLGLNPIRKDQNAPLIHSELQIQEKYFESLWFNQVKSQIIYSYLENYPDPSMNDLHPWIEALNTLGTYKKFEPLSLLKESYQPLLKLSFLEKETDEIIGKQTLPQSSYHIDIQLIERFIKDPETCIKKHFLNIKEAQEVNNKDVSERHLNLWKLQQELNKDSHCDSFAQVDDYKHLKFDFPESKHLRSNLFSDEDHLQNQMILKPLIIYLANDVSLQCLGISTIELEKKIKKNEKLILKFFELKTLISKR